MVDENDKNPLEEDLKAAPEEGQPEPEGQKSEEEEWTTMVGGDKKPEIAPEEKPPEKTEDEVKAEREAFWQKEHSALLEKAKTEVPEFADKFVEQRRVERKAEVQPEPEKTTTPVVEPSEGQDEYVTKSDLEKMARGIVTGVKEEMRVAQAADQQERVEVAHRKEYAAVDQAIVNFRQKHKILDETHNAIMEKALSYGANTNALGGPSALLKAYADLAIQQLKAGKQDEKALTAASEAEQKALAVNMTKQPSSTPAGMQPKRELTFEEKILDGMHAAGDSPAVNEVFGD